MRDDYQRFTDRGAEIVCVSPHEREETRVLAEELALPFPLLADADRRLFLAYDVQSRLWSLGQRPAVYVVDREGVIRFAYVGTQQWDIPLNAEVLRLLDELARPDTDATA